MTGNSTIQVATGAATITNIMTVSGPFTKSGAGTLVLDSGNNGNPSFSFSGANTNLNVSAGAIQLSNSQNLVGSQLNPNTVLNLGSAGALIMGGTHFSDATIGGLTGSAGSQIYNGAAGDGTGNAAYVSNLTITLQGGNTYTFNGAIGSGTTGGATANQQLNNIALNVHGSGTLVLGGISTYSQGTVIGGSAGDAVIVKLGSSTAIPTNTLQPEVSTGGTLDLNGQTITLSGFTAIGSGAGGNGALNGRRWNSSSPGP